MAKVAFIGLGIMGLPMAKNLLAAGHQVTGNNRSSGRMVAFAEAGGHTGASVAECVRDTEVVFLMLPDAPDVERVLAGPDGVLANVAPGTLIIDCSTLAPSAAQGFAKAADAAGCEYLDAPVSGGESGALAGTLTVMAGGSDAAFRKAEPVLAAISANAVHIGGSGSGQMVKAANQLLVAGNAQLLAEAICLLRKLEVDPERAINALRGGMAGSAVMERKAELMIERKFEPGFKIKLHHKDLGILLETARDAGMPLALGGTLAAWMQAAMNHGLGENDHSAIYLEVERFVG